MGRAGLWASAELVSSPECVSYSLLGLAQAAEPLGTSVFSSAKRGKRLSYRIIVINGPTFVKLLAQEEHRQTFLLSSAGARGRFHHFSS